MSSTSPNPDMAAVVDEALEGINHPVTRNGNTAVDGEDGSNKTHWESGISSMIASYAQPSLPYHVLSMRQFSPSVSSFDDVNTLLAHLLHLRSRQPVSVQQGQAQGHAQEATGSSVLAMEAECRMLAAAEKEQPNEEEQRCGAPPFQQCVAIIQGQRIILDPSSSPSNSSLLLLSVSSSSSSSPLTSSTQLHSPIILFVQGNCKSQPKYRRGCQLLFFFDVEQLREFLHVHPDVVDELPMPNRGTMEERQQRPPVPVPEVMTLLQQALVFGTQKADSGAEQRQLAAVFHLARRVDQSEAELQQLKDSAQQLYLHHVQQRTAQEHTFLSEEEQEHMRKLVEKLLPFRQPRSRPQAAPTNSQKKCPPAPTKSQKITKTSSPSSSSSLSIPPPSHELLDAVGELQQMMQTDGPREYSHQHGTTNKYWRWMEEHGHVDLLDQLIPTSARQQPEQQQNGRLAVPHQRGGQHVCRGRVWCRAMTTG